MKSIRILVCMLAVSSTGAALATFKDGIEHVRAFIRHPAQVGAVTPCSTHVAMELCKYVEQYVSAGGAPLRILEVGAGSGAISRWLVGLLRVCDTVDLVEIAPELCTVLHDQFDAYANVSVRCVSILDWQPMQPYDLIVSTLPFTSLEAELVERAVAHFQRLIKPGGIFSYVSYVGVAEAKTYLLWGKKRTEHHKKMAILKEFRKKFLFDKHVVLLNCPPINVYHLKIGCAVQEVAAR